MAKPKTTVCVAGHFNPLHVGHLELFKEARKLGDKLIVIVANDIQAYRKRPAIFILCKDRMKLVYAIKGVDEVHMSWDNDTNVCDTLYKLKPDIFASGCNSNHPDAIAEKKICKLVGIKTVFNVGGKKIRSSSKLLKSYNLLYNKVNLKIKNK